MENQVRQACPARTVNHVNFEAAQRKEAARQIIECHTADELFALAGRWHTQLGPLLAKSPLLDEATGTLLLVQGSLAYSFDTLAMLALNPKLDLASMEQLARHANGSVRALLASNPALPEHLMRAQMTDLVPAGRSLACNDQVPEDLLNLLKNSPDEHTALYAQWHRKAPEAWKSHRKDDPDSLTSVAAWHGGLEGETWQMLLESQTLGTLLGLGSNDLAPINRRLAALRTLRQMKAADMITGNAREKIWLTLAFEQADTLTAHLILAEVLHTEQSITRIQEDIPLKVRGLEPAERTLAADLLARGELRLSGSDLVNLVEDVKARQRRDVNLPGRHKTVKQETAMKGTS